MKQTFVESPIITALQNSNSGFDKLIYQILISLKSKYRNIFSISKYYDNELIDDIQNVLIEKNCPMSYEGAYKTVENEIMKKVKSKCPEPPKTLPKTKVIIDKYEDEDNKDPIKKEELLKERRKLELEKIKEKAKQRKEDLKRFATKQKLGKNRLKKEEVELPEKKPHELIDKYKQRVAYDTRSEMLKKENELYKQVEKKRKEEEREKNNEIQQFLLQQMTEKHNKKINEINENNLFMNEEYENYIKWQEEQKKKNNEKVKKINDFKVDLAQAIRDKEETKRMKKIEDDKINYEILKQVEKNNMEELRKAQEKKQKTKEILLAAEAESMTNRLMRNNKTERIKEDLQLLKINEEMNRKQDLQKELIKQKVRERELEQSYAQNILAQIYQSHEQQVDNFYNKIISGERNSAKNTRKQNEYLEADKNRLQKIEEIKKSLEENIQRKRQDKIKKREDDLKIRNEINKNYTNYLNEQDNLKKKRMERYEQYKKDLEEQIKDKERRELDRIKYQY